MGDFSFAPGIQRDAGNSAEELPDRECISWKRGTGTEVLCIYGRKAEEMLIRIYGGSKMTAKIDGTKYLEQVKEKLKNRMD